MKHEKVLSFLALFLSFSLSTSIIKNAIESRCLFLNCNALNLPDHSFDVIFYFNFVSIFWNHLIFGTTDWMNTRRRRKRKKKQLMQLNLTTWIKQRARYVLCASFLFFSWLKFVLTAAYRRTWVSKMNVFIIYFFLNFIVSFYNI